MPAEVDSLVTVYESSRGEVRIAAGRKLLSLCSNQRALFKDNLELTSSMAPRRQNLVINFAAERYLLTTSYFKEALVYNEKALPMAEEEEDADIHCTLLCDQAYCLFKLSDYSRAVETGQQAMRLCQQEGNTLQLSRAYLYLSLVNHALRKYDEAKALVVKAIETNEKLGDNMQLHNALGVACEIFCSALEVDQAIEYGKRAVEAARAIDFQPGVANHMTQLSYAYDRKGEYELGLQMADSAIAIVKAQEPLDRNQHFTLDAEAWMDYNHSVDLVDASRSLVRSTYWNSTLRLDYRPTARLHIGVKGNLHTQRSSSDRTDFQHISVIDFDYGALSTIELPWDFQFATDLTMYSRRGYADPATNTNELVWNARLTKRFLRGNLLLQLDALDLLGQLSNVRRTINAQGRTETWSNVMPRYALLHVIYRLSKQPKRKQQTNN